MYNNDVHRNEIHEKCKPIIVSTNSDEHQAIKNFAQEVVIVIQSCNINEYYASLELMEAPNITKPDDSPLFERAVWFTNKDNMRVILGLFAGYKAAITWTKQGTSCERDLRNILVWFPKTKAVLGVGVAYGTNAVKFCDVLVASLIADYGAGSRFDHGELHQRSEVISTKTILNNTFCQDDTGWKFPCTKTNRLAKVHVSLMASLPFLLDDAKVKQSIQNKLPFAKGGDMEGWVLYTHIAKDYPDLGVIIIKGVADYADGTKDKRWQLTAAMAAASYTHFQLMNNPRFDGMHTL